MQSSFFLLRTCMQYTCFACLQPRETCTHSPAGHFKLIVPDQLLFTCTATTEPSRAYVRLRSWLVTLVTDPRLGPEISHSRSSHCTTWMHPTPIACLVLQSLSIIPSYSTLSTGLFPGKCQTQCLTRHKLHAAPPSTLPTLLDVSPPLLHRCMSMRLNSMHVRRVRQGFGGFRSPLMKCWRNSR
jgi:hypothetical protein